MVHINLTIQKSQATKKLKKKHKNVEKKLLLLTRIMRNRGIGFVFKIIYYDTPMDLCNW